MFVQPAAGRPLRAGHSAGLVPGSTRRCTHAIPTVFITGSVLASHHSRQTTADYGQCIRLGKTAFACMPCLHHPEANPRTTQTQARADLPSRGKDEQKRLVFLSLHDVKDHKGPNEYQTVSQTPWIHTRGSMPVAERRQSKKPDETRQRTRPESGGGFWWVEEDLNLRPHAYQACALTS